MLTDLSDEARQYAKNEEWGRYRNTRYDTAKSMAETDWKRAGVLYVEVLIFDLQGVTSTPYAEGSHEPHQTASPVVVREVARFSIRTGMSEDDLRAVYDRVADQVWIEAFPRSRDELWTEIRAQVWKQRETIQLDERVDALGADELLSEAEAEAYVKRKDEYQIIRRVEQLLEHENPVDIPAEKRERVKKYLGALDPESLGNRWKAKFYRRGGEIMLSQNGWERALEYFEQALESVDLDERAEVERLVAYLRDESAS